MNSILIKQMIQLIAVVAVFAVSAGFVRAQDDAVQGNDSKVKEGSKSKSTTKTRKVIRNSRDSKSIKTGIRFEQNQVGSLWVGIFCVPASPELRAHLNLPNGKGVMIQHVVKETPAAKAGLKQYDVLLRAGDVELSNVSDLAKAVRDAGRHELKIELIQGGKPKTVMVTPTERKVTGLRVRGEIQNHERLIEELNQRLRNRGYRASAFTRVRPGIVLDSGSPGSSRLEITITKKNNEPEVIVVKRADKAWKVTEEGLGKLPEDIRARVTKMLAGRRGAKNELQQLRKLLPRGSKVEPIFLRGTDRDLEKRFEEINRRLDLLQKAIEKLPKQFKE